MLRTFKPILLFILAMFVLYSCNKNNEELLNSEDTGTLSIYLTDAPAAYDSVCIVFTEISAHIDSEWVTVLTEPTKVNLLDYSNGNLLPLSSEDVPAGKYSQIRVKIDSAYIVVDGEFNELDVPSGTKTGLKFGPEFTVTAGSTYEIVMDFDASQSIVVLGPKKNPKGYKLKPHIRIISKAVSGSISATVSNNEHLPVAYAIQSGDTVTSSMPDTSSGYFMLAFLGEGTYTVSVIDTLNQTYQMDSVQVTNGSNNDLGSITLN